MKKLNQLLKDPRKAIVLAGLVLAMLILKVVLDLDAVDFTAADLDMTDGAAYWVNFLVDFSLFITYFLIGTCLAGSFSLFVYRMIQNSKKAIRFGILLAVATIVFVICYATATSDVSTMNPKLEFTPGLLKLIGGLVSYTLTLIVIGLVGAVVSSVVKIAK